MRKAEILDREIRTLAQQERTLLAELLVKIRELDLSNGYLELGVPSLFEYLTSKVGYSAGSAQRRIDAARLLRVAPDLTEKIISGAINLSKVTLVKKCARQVAKTRAVSRDEEREVLSSIEGLSDHESRKTVADFFDLPVIEQTKKTVQRDGSVRIQITISRQLAAKLERAQELVSHSVPSNQLVDFLEYACTKVIEARSRVPKARAEAGAKSIKATDAHGNAVSAAQPPSQKAAPPTATVAVKGTKTADEAIPNRLRREVLSEEPCCQMKTMPSGKVCGSRWQLQVDHIEPRWAGGVTRRENLRTLCARHNQARYKKDAGIQPSFL